MLPHSEQLAFAHGQWAAAGGDPGAILSVEKVFDVGRQGAFDQLCRRYDKEYGLDGHSVVAAWHGASTTSVADIALNGFGVVTDPNLKTDDGFIGLGVYTSRSVEQAAHYSGTIEERRTAGQLGGGCTLLACQVALGRPFLVRGGGLSGQKEPVPGYTTHVSDAARRTTPPVLPRVLPEQPALPL